MSKAENTMNEQFEEKVRAGIKLMEQSEREYKKALKMRYYEGAEKYYIFWESMRDMLDQILNMVDAKDGAKRQAILTSSDDLFVAFCEVRADGAVRIPETIWEEWGLTGGNVVYVSQQSKKCLLLLKVAVRRLNCIACTVTDDGFLCLPESIAEPEKDVIYRFEPFLSGTYSLHKIYRSELAGI